MASRCGAIPKSLCFPSPPLCRPSSLFLFLFCCRFNFSSWTLSVLPERYLVFPLPVWHPPALLLLHSSRFPPAGQGSTLSRSPEQRLVTVSTAPFCLVGGDFCPVSHPHPPLKGGLERGYWCFPVCRLLWGPLHLHFPPQPSGTWPLCCRPSHPGGCSFRAWPSGGPHPASLLGLLLCGPVNPFTPEWKGSLAPFSVSRVQAKGAEGSNYQGGALAVSYVWGRRQNPSGHSHSGCHLAGAVLLSFLPRGVLCGLWMGWLWGMSLSGGRVTSP